MGFIIIVALSCLIAVSSILADTTTTGTFYSARYPSGEVGNSQGKDSLITKMEHHQCAMKDQCGFVVNKDDKKMETVDQESDLTNVQPKKVVWKKQRFPGDFNFCGFGKSFTLLTTCNLVISAH